MTSRTGSLATPEPLVRSALSYARDGWPVLPLRTRGKQPLTRHGVKDASTDTALISGWWKQWPTANIGLAVPQGYLVVDLDSPKALAQLKASDRCLPSTARATTGRGEHLWYSTPGKSMGNRVGLFPGVDIRALGGYVVAPPSIHPSGALYRWQVELSPASVAECPEWLLEQITPSPPRRSVDDWYRRISEPVPKGTRNESLAQVAGLLFRRLPAQAAAELAVCWAKVKLSPPLPDREVWRTLDSIAGRERRRREVQG
jgi:hypothetical protein